MNTDTNTPVVITGMHRSGTSLLASAMQAAGVAIGDDLLGASKSNVHGHFEDLEFLNFHENVFADHGRTWYDVTPSTNLAVSPERRKQAESLVAARAHQPVWGWKDPRTCMFLNFWGTLLPSAKFVFIFRRPDEVMASLQRRREKRLLHHFRGAWVLRQFGCSTFRARFALEKWSQYNSAIIECTRRWPERCRVVESSDLPSQLPPLIRHMRESWELPVNDIDLEAIIDDRLLRSAGGANLERRARTAATMLAELRQLAAG